MGPPLLRLTACTVDLVRLEVTRDGQVEALTPLEVDLLAYLVARPGCPVTRGELLTEVWGYAPGVRSRAVDHTASRLRAKLEADPSEPDHLIGVRGIGYRYEPPPHAAESPHLEGFPQMTGDFVGGVESLDALDGLVSGPSRLAVIKGPAGVGKTRLAWELARRPGGPPAVCVSLQGLTLAADLVHAVGQALGSPPRVAGTAGARQVGHALSARGSLLLVLDGFAGLVGSACSAVLEWLERAPELRVIVTSRVQPDLGARVVLLEGLTLDDAVALLVRRAAERGGVLDPDGPDGPILISIAALLDGLPLALEFAAGRASLVSPRELLALLERPGRVLGPLSAALSGSWALLSADERAALVGCAAFSGDFSLQAAEGVLASAETLDHLHALHAHSLVIAGRSQGRIAEGRFHLLTSARAFVEGEVPAELAEARRRHTRWYADACKGWARGPDAETRLALELRDLEAAHARLCTQDAEAAATMALALAPVLLGQGPVSRLLPLLEKNLATGIGDATRGALKLALGRALRITGDVGPAEGALQRAQDLGDSKTAAQALQEVGNLRRHQGRLVEAEQALQKAADPLRGTDGASAWARDLGSLRLAQGRLEEARVLYTDALQGARTGGDRAAEGWLLANLGNVGVEKGDQAGARRHFDLSLQVHRERGDRRFEGIVLSNLGLLDLERGALDRARERFGEALELHRSVGNRRFEGHALSALGAVAHQAGNRREAQRRQQQALQVFLEVRDRTFEGIARARLAVLDAVAGRGAEARVGFETAREALDRREALLEGVAILEAVAAGDRVVLPEGAGSFARISARLGGLRQN